MTEAKSKLPIYIISGASGASGEQLVHTVLAQFPGLQLPVITVPHVRHKVQVKNILTKVEQTGGIIVHTLVDADLRSFLIEAARNANILAIDLMGQLLSWIFDTFEVHPAGKPGLYRQLRKDYFDRVSAIEFSIKHDDAQYVDELKQAEIVLIGASRVGKTPLSMFLAVLGWKVANIPLVLGMKPPEELFRIDHRRIIGLTIKPERLTTLRMIRQQQMGLQTDTVYNNPKKVVEEIDETNRFFQKHEYSVINVTNKPIETSANEIIKLITSRFKEKARKSQDLPEKYDD